MKKLNNECIIKEIPKKCKICGKMTNRFNFLFEEYMCSIECEDEVKSILNKHIH